MDSDMQGLQEDVNMDEYFMGIALLCEKRSKDPRRQVGACVVNTSEQVIGTGYNGAPLNCHDCLIPWENETKIPSTETNVKEVGGKSNKQEPSEQQRKKTEKVKKEESENKESKEKKPHAKHDYVCHAELNALVNKDPKRVTSCTLYVTLFPCSECAKVIVRTGGCLEEGSASSNVSNKRKQRTKGITKVVYLSDDKACNDNFKAARHILESNGVTLEQFTPISKEPYKMVLHFFKTIKKKEKSIQQTSEERKETEKTIIGWKRYFMALAKFTAEIRCISDPKQGACIVNKDKRIVGLGFVHESMGPVSCESTDQEYDANLTVCHAPVSAIVNENPSSLRDCTMYVTHYPCKECAKVIVQSGIQRVIYLDKANGESATHDPTTTMFAIAHIKVKKYQISIEAADVSNMEGANAAKRKLDEELTIDLDYAEVIAKKKMKEDNSST